MKIQFNRFYRYTEFSATLHQLVAEFPHLLSIQSIGKSHEGRDIWLLSATNQATGAADDKPAFWVDANLHASELSGGTAVLYLLDTLTRYYGQRDDITRLLDTRTLYICPSINPDGAEWAMQDPPVIIRSSTRPYPFDEEPIQGLDVQDVDGDGRILSMRIPDPNGAWKCHPQEPRLMIKREPAEYGGQYYRIIREGRIHNYDGVTIKNNLPKQGLDLNRNFPGSWRQEHEQFGAGPYPTSEPEVRALVQFITHHPNISGATSFHTWSGVLLRPFASHPDDNMPTEDLWVYQVQGQQGERLTGYPAISTFHEFSYDPKDKITGAFDWIYEHLGMYVWTVEIWSPMRAAGIVDYHAIEWMREHPVEDDLKMLAWADREVPGQGYVDWKKFNHPQLGEVEIGGWNKLAMFSAPPLHLLEQEVAKFPDWIIWQALLSPKLELLRANTQALGAQLYELELVLQNTGYLPSYGSKQALKHEQTRGVVVELSLPPGARLVSGKLREMAGELEGRAYKHSLQSFWIDSTPTADRTRLAWVIDTSACQGEALEVHVVAKHEKAGTVRVGVALGGKV
jgi:murein tripeptide amidase MpaA